MKDSGITKPLEGKLLPKTSSEGVIISPLNVGSPYSPQYLSPPLPLHRRDSEPQPSKSDGLDHASPATARHEGRRRALRARLPNFSGNDRVGAQINTAGVRQNSYRARWHSCPVIGYSISQEERVNVNFAPIGEIEVVWPLPPMTRDQNESQRYDDQRAAAARNRRWSLPCKASPSRAMSRAKGMSNDSLQKDGTSPILERDTCPGIEPLVSDHVHPAADTNDRRAKGRHTHPHVDTPAMITLRRASTRLKDGKVTIISKMEETNPGSGDSAADNNARRPPHKGIHFAARTRGGRFGDSAKSQVAEPATTIAELHIGQSSTPQPSPGPELRRKQSGSSKIISGKTLHEVIWQDYTSSSSASSRESCKSEAHLLWDPHDLHPSSAGAEVRRFSLPEVSTSLITHLHDVRGLSPGMSAARIEANLLNLALEPSTILRPLQRFLTWSLGPSGLPGESGLEKPGLRSRSASAGLSLFGFRPRGPELRVNFETQLEDNGFTATIDRVEFFPPLESRRDSVKWKVRGVADLNDPCTQSSPSGDFSTIAAPDPSSAVWSDSPELSPTHDLPTRSLARIPQTSTDFPRTKRTRKASVKPRLPESGQALGASSHRRLKFDTETQLGRLEPRARIHGKSSDGLILLERGDPHRKSIAHFENSFQNPSSSRSSKRKMARRAKSLDLLASPFSALDILLPARYMQHQFQERRKSAYAGRIATFPVEKNRERLVVPHTQHYSRDVHFSETVNWND